MSLVVSFKSWILSSWVVLISSFKPVGTGDVDGCVGCVGFTRLVLPSGLVVGSGVSGVSSLALLRLKNA